MALFNATLIGFLVLSLTFSLLCPYSAPQPTQPSASEARSGVGPKGGQMYVVAPTLEDCPNDTQCEALSYYAEKYTNKLSNVVFWFLPGTHNLSQTWQIKNSRNVTLLGGIDLTSSDKSSGGMSKILCQKLLYVAGIYVRKSNFTVLESITIENCSSAVLVYEAVDTTVRNVTFTRSITSLQVTSCQRFTITNSKVEYCFFGINLLKSSSSEISNSQISNCLITSIMWQKGGSVTLNQVISDGGNFAISFVQGSAKASSLGEKPIVNISNSRILLRESSTSAIYVLLSKDQPIDINIDSVSISGNGGGILGICITDYSPEAGSKPN